MRFKSAMLFWTDVLIALLFAVMIATGAILRWVLPPGSGGGGGGLHGMGQGWRGGRGPASVLSLWDMTRHEWGDVHFWVAISLVTMIGLHLALHWGWLKANTWRWLIRPLIPHRAAPASTAIR